MSSVPLWSILLFAACSDPQDVMNPAGPQAERIARLGWTLIGVAAVVALLVYAALAMAVWRGRRRAARGEPADVTPAGERRIARVNATAAAVSLLILLLFVVASAATGRAISWPKMKDGRGTTPIGDQAPLTVEVTGHQYWWEMRYVDPSDPSRSLTTSNELHIPVGRPVRVVLKTRDVIHSFWIPNLHGKQDMVPGHDQQTYIRADRPGYYRGQCAEFCGHQHAKMAFDVVAEPAAQFQTWYENSLMPAAAPPDSSARRGQRVFLSSSCVMCHAINGTPAGSRVGPELTHLASRLTIAAGTLPNTRGHLGGWVMNPQAIKPGSHMPANELSPDELNALLDYLRSLK
ncbi:MAG TPA: cytochrome c oxidase subunit II [Gemmatimonadaceae bacterium]|nr:cytochrome c oxidase subunit II [Gemmatimonadaceae bacterium]